MNTYVTPYQKDVLSKQSLTEENGVYRLGEPGTLIHSIYITEFAHRLCLAGDTCIGGNENGIVSNVGYGIEWFSGRLSEGYLCEKFFRQKWQWEAAVEQLEWQIKTATEETFDYDGGNDSWWCDNADKIHEFIKADSWKYDVPCANEFYEFMEELDVDHEELEGYDYPRQQAGWLCAIQQRFVELRKIQ